MTKEKKEEKKIDFFSKLIGPHHVESRPVKESDLERVMKDAHILYNMCYTQFGKVSGAYAMAHPQITKKDPLRFFVTRDKEIIINPEIVNHTKDTIDSEEGCITFYEYAPVTTQRWNKCEVLYRILSPDGKSLSDKKRENLSGRRAKVFQHEIQHFDASYIYDIIDT